MDAPRELNPSVGRHLAPLGPGTMVQEPTTSSLPLSHPRAWPWVSGLQFCTRGSWVRLASEWPHRLLLPTSRPGQPHRVPEERAPIGDLASSGEPGDTRGGHSSSDARLLEGPAEVQGIPANRPCVPLGVAVLTVRESTLTRLYNSFFFF